MNLGASGLKQDLHFFLLAGLSIVLIILESHSALLQSTRSVVFVTVKPLIEVAQLPTKATNSIRQILEEREQLRERNRIVNQENTELRERIIQLKNEELRSKWLAELLRCEREVAVPSAICKPKIDSIAALVTEDCAESRLQRQSICRATGYRP